jgi:hypothetical protein
MLTGSAQAATVTLAWDRNTEPGVLGYYLRYGTASRTYTLEVHAGNQTSYTLTLNPSNTTTYYFAVQAYNAAGRSAFSAEVSTTVTAGTPVLTIDRPLENSVMPGDMLLSGWALDQSSTSGSGVDAVHVYAYPVSGAPSTFVGVASYGTARPDVAAAYGARFLNSGYALPIASLPPGAYHLAFYGHSTVSNSFNIVRTRRVTVYHPSAPPPPSNTIVNMDMPASFSTVNSWLAIGGWALDLRPGTGTGVDLVQVWAYPNPGSGAQPIMLGNAQYGRTRQDVATAFRNSRFRASGFHMDVMGMQPGVYDIVTIARNTTTGTIDTARVKRVTVDPAVVITVDNPLNGASATGSFMVGGWAIDKRATGSTSGIDVLHVYAYPTSGVAPTFLGEFVPNSSRADVAAVFGSRYRFSGFNVPISGLAPGAYDIVIYAHSTTTWAFENIRILRINVQ